MEKDLESQSVTKIPHWKLILDQGVLTPEVEAYHYKGHGTDEDPYVSDELFAHYVTCLTSPAGSYMDSQRYSQPPELQRS